MLGSMGLLSALPHNVTFREKAAAAPAINFLPLHANAVVVT
jgi:hypothetical protein